MNDSPDTEYVPLPGEGDTRIQVRKRRECAICGLPATKRCSYLWENYRSDPASSAYHHDDCSYCSDDEAFACDAHVDTVRRDTPRGMVEGSVFHLPRFARMLLYWETQS